jgi:hypothetical protein
MMVLLRDWKTSRVVVHRFLVPDCGLYPDPDPEGRKRYKRITKFQILRRCVVYSYFYLKGLRFLLGKWP